VLQDTSGGGKRGRRGAGEAGKAIQFQIQISNFE
jgi:hypothetical protein